MKNAPDFRVPFDLALCIKITVVALYEGQWDIRLLVSCLKKLTDKKELDLEDLPPINPLKIKSELKKLLAVINSIPQLDHNKVN